MSTWQPDPTFYPSPQMAMDAPREQLGYVTVLNPLDNGRPDALAVLDLDTRSTTYGKVIQRVTMPYAGDELHHFGWNACSVALCPWAPHPHVERRYLLVPGLRSSRIYVIDTQPDPRHPRIIKVIEAEEIHKKTGYSRPHTIHCGPDDIYVNALGAPDGNGPGGVFTLDHKTFAVKGPWEKARGPQTLAYDFWWHITQDTMITSEWGTPRMVENGLIPEELLAGKYGHHIHIWDMRKRHHVQALDLGAEQQMVLELRPAHDPNQTYGFAGVVISLKDLSSSIWLWHQENGKYAVRKVIEIPAEPTDPALLPPILQGFGAAPPLVTDINLSLDDKMLYVSCWGTGELRQYNVSDPFHPRLTGCIELGGMVRHAAHPQSGPLNGAPQMVEISRDGKRLYSTNSLYSALDAQFYPEGIRGWMAQVDADPNGGLKLNPDFFIDFGPERPHQVRLQGGDASSDSYCYPNA